MNEKATLQCLKSLKANEAAFKILLYLSTTQFPVKLRDLISVLNLKRPTVKKALTKLNENRLIFSPKHGYYVSTIKFVDLLADRFTIYEQRLSKLERG